MSDDESLEVARRFVANAPFPLSLLDLEGRFIEVSPFILQMVEAAGFTRDFLIGLPAGEFVSAGERSVGEALERLAAGEQLVELERKLSLHNGRHYEVRVQGSYWRNSQGKPLAVLFSHQDATAEVDAQAAQRKVSAQLRAVMDNIPAQIALVDLDAQTIELMNAGLVAATRALSEANPAKAEAMKAQRVAELTAAVRAAEEAGGAWETEREIYDGKGGKRWGRVKHILFKDADGRRQLLWMAEDITELTDATEGLKRAVEEAEGANRAKSEFLANMSHEIRTPLNGVMGVAGALAKTKLSPPQREMVTLVETSAKTLETLLSDILDLARIEAGKMEIRPEPFDLEASVNACATLFDAAAQAKGLDLKVHIAPGARGGYLGDAARIRQILSNLLGNAVKFTEAGEVALTVTAKPGPISCELAFEVRDTGIGFDQETKNRLFSRFEQADGSITRRFGGSGLGLSISRSLAEAMGGRLEAEAAPGAGAIFTLRLELLRCDDEFADESEDAADAELEDAAGDPLVGMRVLLAEDHPTNRRVVELILGAAGVRLTCVENGAEAVQAFRQGDFDLILMDMQMPVMDGLSAIRAIRDIEATCGAQRTLIHVLTANAMPEHVNASLSAGADGHLSKPILADALIARVAESAAAIAARPARPARPCASRPELTAQ